MSQKTKSTTGAFYNADSGVEWALYKITNSDSSVKINSLPGVTFNPDGSAQCPFGGCNVFFLKDDGTVITQAQAGSLYVSDIKAVRSVGTQGGETQRVIEAAVAAGMDCQIKTNFCDADTCQADCPSGYKVIAGGWSGFFFENIDQNRPADGNTGWLVVDAGHVSGQTNTVYATCCKY